MIVYELNMDGLVGPTHHYAGLALGNLASEHHAAESSNPRAAAKQGLKKMRLLHSLGLKQALMPPHQRPNLQLLHQLGFTGRDTEQIQKVSRHPSLLNICYSASSMWTANAATVSPSSDTTDHKVHFTSANLITNLHRQQETNFTKRLLGVIFHDARYFHHHSPLPCSPMTSDEGAANHTRFCQNHAAAGLHLFVYGKDSNTQTAPRKYPARQTLEASQAIARLHQLKSNQLVFARQNPKAIDLGVFHNDVISVGNESLFLVHEEAFFEQKSVLNALLHKANFPLQIIQVFSKDIPIEEAVESYLFNSQLITLPVGQMALIAPSECQYNLKVNDFIEQLIHSPKNPISTVHFLNLKQSMHNGGGPACLRLRIPLTEQELLGMHPGVLVDETLLDQLEVWVDTHYRDHLVASDLTDPHLMKESFQALDALTQILKLGSIYPFQEA